MGILSEPKPDGRGERRGLVLALLAGIVVAATAAALWVLARPPAGPPKAPPLAPRARTSPTPRTTPGAPAVPGAQATPRPRAQPRPETASAVASLKVDADVPGANVFLDRKFVGTTPVETRGFEPGSHRLNVSAEGYEMHAETIDLGAGPSEVMVLFKEVKLDERLEVTHKHGVGSCRGRLVATVAGLRYESEKAGDSFAAPFSSLEPLQVDYLNRNLRVKQRGGKTWNFTADSADALLVFQKAVEGARKRL
jgi:hypothetical protein